MDETTKLVLIYGAFPLIGGGITYMLKSLLTRITDIEKELPQKLNESQVRILVADKIVPLKEALDRCEQKLDKIQELLMNR